jgi:branched-chain amino acid transport system ATP-binding protein
MLRIDGVNASIEGVHVLRDVHMEVASGGTVALIGRNGAGKTTLLRTIMGFLPHTSGRIALDGEDLAAIPAHRRPGLGIGYAPEDRRLFPTFTVEENIRLPGEVTGLSRVACDERLALVYDVAPELTEFRNRGAGQLSGGQGKMVALGRALMIGTKLVLLDEPFQGLAPALANRYAEVLQTLHEAYPEITLLITESNPRLLRHFAETTYTIERGEIALTGDFVQSDP